MAGKMKKSKINVLMVADHLGWDGRILHGVGKNFLKTIPRFSKDFNVVPIVLRKKDELDKYFQELDIKIRYLGRDRFDPRTVTDLMSIIRNENIHLMHLQGYGASTFGRISGLINQTPFIVHQRDEDAVYPKYMFLPDIIFGRHTNFGLSVSQHTKNWFSKKRKIPLEKIKVLINPIDIEKITSLDRSKLQQIKREVGHNHNTSYIGSITRFYPVKGVDILIRAIPEILNSHPAVRFVICGDGPLFGKMKALAKELGVSEYISFPGFVPHPEFWLSMFDIYVHTAFNEPCGNSILEAMALKKPIVITRGGGHEEFLKHGFSALYAESGDFKTVAKNVSTLLDDPQLRSFIANNARKSAGQHEVGNYVEKIEDFYRYVINSCSN
jgi:glycosyltransferase involved in cell wall biosynthesis